jgi:RNA polymerase sigma-70 factor, ECF subfamily
VTAFPPTNDRLIASIATAGNKSDWSEFVRLYEPGLIAWLQRKGLRPHDAQDCCQRVLVRLLQSIGKFQNDGRDGSFRRWLYRVARNETVSFLRQESKHLRCSHDSKFLSQLISKDVGDADLTVELETQFRRQAFMQAAQIVQGQVASHHWSAFWNAYVLGQPTPRVARDLDMTVGAVYVAKGRILKLLQQQIVAMEIEP